MQRPFLKFKLAAELKKLNQKQQWFLLWVSPLMFHLYILVCIAFKILQT